MPPSPRLLLQSLLRRTSTLTHPHIPTHTHRSFAAAAAAAAIPSDKLNRVVKISSNSRFALREDIHAGIATALEGGQPKKLDPILFKGIYPGNAWLVELHSQEAAQRLVKMKEIHASGGIMHVEVVKGQEAVTLQVASELGLDETCVQVQNVPEGMGLDEMAYFFKEFNVVRDGIRMVEADAAGATLLTQQTHLMQQYKQKGGRHPHHPHHHHHPHDQAPRVQETNVVFLIKFDSSDEAQRAIREKQFEWWGNRKIHILPYK